LIRPRKARRVIINGSLQLPSTHFAANLRKEEPKMKTPHPAIVLKLSFALLAFSTIPAFAEENHPCEEYVKHCKAQDLSPGHGLWKCVAREAKKAKNEACIAKVKEGAKRFKERVHEAKHSKDSTAKPVESGTPKAHE
jgi:hypothetical protein